MVVDSRGLVEADELLFGSSGGFVGPRGHGQIGAMSLLERPGVALPVVHEARPVVALVEVLENGREDLRLLVGKCDAALAWGLEELLAARLLEPRRAAQHVLVGCEEAYA